MLYTYEIQSTIYFETLLDSLKEELNLKEGKIIYYEQGSDDEVEVEEILPINELKDKAMEVFFYQDYFSLIFPNVEVNLKEDGIEIESEVKLALKGIDRDEIVSDDLQEESNLKLNLDNFKSEDMVW